LPLFVTKKGVFVEVNVDFDINNIKKSILLEKTTSNHLKVLAYVVYLLIVLIVFLKKNLEITIRARTSSFFVYNKDMSKWAVKRKRRILIVLGIIVLGILSFVLIKINNKPSTCFDQRQNGQEVGVDCGGGCLKICNSEVRNIVTWWERPFKVTENVYNVVAYFENQNLQSGIQEVEYEFRMYDKDNILVSEPRVGKTFIEPNKRSAIFESGITTSGNEAYTVFFKIDSVQEWERTDQSFSYSLFQVGEPVLSNQDTAPKLSAPVENKTFFNFVDVPVVVILYNQDDNAIAASQTYLDKINQGEKTEVFYSWPQPFGEVVSRIEVIPRIDPFINRELQ